MGAADVLRDGPGKAFMLCNEAMVRGAIEADVKVDILCLSRVSHYRDSRHSV